jgi:hypothetical protein
MFQLEIFHLAQLAKPSRARTLGRIRVMSRFSALLRKAAAEVRHHCATAPDVKQAEMDWLLSLARQMDVASALESDAEVEREIHTLHYSIIDSGPLPLTVRFAPSFDRAVAALQRRRKRERQE